MEHNRLLIMLLYLESTLVLIILLIQTQIYIFLFGIKQKITTKATRAT